MTATSLDERIGEEHRFNQYKKDLFSVFLLDEASVQYSRKTHLKHAKGIGVGMGEVRNGRVQLVDWEGIVSYKKGVKSHWKVLLEMFTPAILEPYVFDYSLYACNFVHPLIEDSLKGKLGNGYRVNGFTAKETERRVRYVMSNLTSTPKGSKFYGKKETVGELVKRNLEDVGENVLRNVLNMKCFTTSSPANIWKRKLRKFTRNVLIYSE